MGVGVGVVHWVVFEMTALVVVVAVVEEAEVPEMACQHHRQIELYVGAAVLAAAAVAEEGEEQ